MKLFFAGSESKTFFNLLYEGGVRRVLVSYFYLRTRPNMLDYIAETFERDGGELFMDSGAFSFIDAAAEEGSAVDWNQYIVDYVDFLRRNKDKIQVAANLDIEKVVGKEQVDVWNREYFEPLEREGMQIIYVWHREREQGKQIKEWEEYCKKYRYIGFSGVVESGYPATTMFNIARKYQTKVHGFGFTKIEYVKKLPFYSVDSTSWLMGGKFGTTFETRGNRWQVYGKEAKHRRKQQKTLLKDSNVNWDLLMKDKYKEVHKMNIKAWLGWEGIVNRHLQGKMYYNIPRNRTAYLEV